jgi:hypoxanthine phosphoribosyltransferase
VVRVPEAHESAFTCYRGHDPPRFANDAEHECARLLDYYGVAWQYEPYTFALDRDGEGRVVEAFTPDFYLPELDLYLEITTQRPGLGTRKRRKVRRLRECYPGINVRLFERRDVELLARRHGLRMGA